MWVRAAHLTSRSHQAKSPPRQEAKCPEECSWPIISEPETNVKIKLIRCKLEKQEARITYAPWSWGTGEVN